jgi:hypothetical protein
VDWESLGVGSNSDGDDGRGIATVVLLALYLT